MVQPSEDNMYTYDKLKRKHYNRLVSGPSLLVLRATKFQVSSAATHANDILPLLKGQVKDGRGIVFLKVDKGSGWDLHLVINELFFCR